MGGSIAKAIRSNVLGNIGEGALGKILALDKNADSLEAARLEGIIDAGFTPEHTVEMLSECDFVFICLYPHSTLEFLKANNKNFKKGAVITDISGVKALLEAEYPQIVPEGTDFIMGHPMAGGEKEGFLNSKGEYFVNHNYIIIQHAQNKPENVEMFKKLVKCMGFSKITEADAGTHDDKIGFTSQLCHVVASAMVESASDTSITSFGGGSFEDLTRIAMINAPLWTELFLSNKEKLLKHIESFQNQMSEFERLIKNDDSENLRKKLEEVRTKRIEMQKQNLKN